MERVKYYAKRIQNNEKDLRLKTTSFPHIGIYADVFILKNKKGKKVVFEDQSALKEKQEAFEKWQENSKKIQEKLQRPNNEKGEAIQTFADDVSPGDMDFVFDLDDDARLSYYYRMLVQLLGRNTDHIRIVRSLLRLDTTNWM